jgi:pilus assembly protein Flp/PilA
MRSRFPKLLLGMRVLIREDGQDLVEYALVVALIAFSATAGMRSLAGNISSAFTRIGTNLTTNVQ